MCLCNEKTFSADVDITCGVAPAQSEVHPLMCLWGLFIIHDFSPETDSRCRLTLAVLAPSLAGLMGCQLTYALTIPPSRDPVDAKLACR